MSFKKSVRNSVFFVVMAITAVLLCVVGVHAVNMNLHFTAKVSPDILCKIDCQNDTGKATIYDYSVQNQDAVGNTLNTTVVASGVSSNLTFTLYNHTTNKNIRLSVENVTFNGNPVQSYTYQPAVASFATSQSSPTQSIMTLSVTNASTSKATITVHLKVEEVFSINLSGTGLATADTYYFAPADTITMPLTASVGYQLPQSITSLDNTKYTTTYTHTKNTSGSVTITKSNSASELVLTNNLSLTCNCEQVFAIKENKATSMFASGNTVALSSSANYLPNNGDYTYSNTQAVKGSGFKEYKYYVEMGEYPQTEVTDSATINALNSIQNYIAKPQHPVIIKNTTYNLTVRQVTYNNQNYVGTTTIETTTTYDPDTDEPITTFNISNGFTWFEVEPIIWLVLDRDDGGNLDNLTFNNGMFYTDKLCGKAYTGGLLLMSAYTLDGQYFGNSSLTDFSNSQVSLFLNSNDLAQSTAIKDSQNNQFSHLKGNYAKAIDQLTTTVQSTEADGGELAGYGNTNLSSHFFLLAGNNADETFYFEKYYKNGIPAGENKGNLTYSVAVTAPTDFAKAHYAETNQITASTGTTYTASANQGWVVNNGTQNVIDEKQGETSVYWSRSYGLASQTAMVSNFNGAMVSVLTKNSNIGVRPCFVLDLNHYNTEVFYGN